MIDALLHALGRTLRQVGGIAAALLILFEEWGWEPLQRALAMLARLPVLRRIEGAVARLPPAAALAVLALPSLLLIPIKLAALWLIAQGRPLTALSVLLVAKLVGTAIVARLFTLTRPALMRMPRFASAYGRWVAWKQAWLDLVRASWAWRWARRVRTEMRRRWRTWKQGRGERH